MTFEHLTSQQVLDILRELHRQMSANGDAIGCLSFDMDSTVEDWRDAMMVDYFNWRNTGITLNWLFETNIHDEMWHELLVPTKSKKLGPLCDYIASQSTMPVIEPLSILGMRCKAAGAFLVLRDQLESRGLDVSDLHPSAPLEPFLIDHLVECYPTLAKLGASGIPEIKIRKPLYTFCLWGFIACCFSGIIVLSLELWFDWDYLPPSIVLIMFIAVGILLYTGMWVSSRMKPRRVSTGDLHNFRDLCRLLVSGDNPA